MILQRCTHPRPCYDDGKCHYKGECGHKAPLTNADRIRAMSDEELAELIDRETDSCAPTGDCERMSRDCKACWLEWLQQPAEEDKHEAV